MEQTTSDKHLESCHIRFYCTSHNGFEGVYHRHKSKGGTWVNDVEGTNVTTGPKFNKGPKCNNNWS